MSFSRDTCRMTDGSMIIGKRLSSIPLFRPLKLEPCHPNIGETDIIDSAVFLINDGEPIPLDVVEDSREVTGRGQRRSAGLAQGLGQHGRFGLDPHTPSRKALRVLDGIEPSFFFFNDTATTEIYTLSLHDALPI